MTWEPTRGSRHRAPAWAESTVWYGRVSPSWLFTTPRTGDSGSTDMLGAPNGIFEIPLPEGLRSSTHRRRLRLTLAWFSPINSRHQSYRRARLALVIPATSRTLLEVGRAEVHNDAAVRGTVQHELLEGTDAPVFDEGDRFGVSVTPGRGLERPEITGASVVGHPGDRYSRRASSAGADARESARTGIVNERTTVTMNASLRENLRESVPPATCDG